MVSLRGIPLHYSYPEVCQARRRDTRMCESSLFFKSAACCGSLDFVRTVQIGASIDITVMIHSLLESPETCFEYPTIDIDDLSLSTYLHLSTAFPIVDRCA